MYKAACPHLIFTACRLKAAIFSRLVPSLLANSLGLNKGLRTWPLLVNPKLAYFGRNVLIGYSVFRREKPFADEEHSG